MVEDVVDKEIKDFNVVESCLEENIDMKFVENVEVLFIIEGDVFSLIEKDEIVCEVDDERKILLLVEMDESVDGMLFLDESKSFFVFYS